MPVGQPRPGYHSVTPRVFVDDVAGLVGFLREVFDATGAIDPHRPTEVRIGDSLVMVASTTERAAHPAYLYVYVDDADAAFQRAVTAGAAVLEGPRDTPYGDRRAMVSDAWGNVYQIAHPLPGA